jgi:hypothetical protein
VDDDVDRLVAEQLGRIERMNARKALERLPGQLERGEAIELLGVGELPRDPGRSRWRPGREVAVVAVTDRHVVIVGSHRDERLPIRELGTVLGEHRMTGGRFSVQASDGRTIALSAFQPQGRAAELADLIRVKRV